MNIPPSLPRDISVDASPQFRLVLERERDKAEREGPLLPEVRSC